MPENILLIDSENEIQAAFLDAVGKDPAHFVLMTARDARDALEKLKTFKAQLVILEIVLPVVSGYHLIKAIHQQYPEISIILYTRLKKPQDLAKMAAANVSNIFLKGLINPEELLHKITPENRHVKIDETVLQLNEQIKSLMESEVKHVQKFLQCPKCHLIVPPDSHFCNNCGEKILQKKEPELIGG